MFRSNRTLQAAAPVAMTGALALAIGHVPAPVETERHRGDSAPTRHAADDRSSAFGIALADPDEAPSADAPEGASGASGSSGSSGSSPTYTVRAGDTITGIAIRHGLRTVDLLEWNGLYWSSTIYPGQELTLRAAGSVAPAPAPQQAASGSGTYTVQAGDTLWAIAQKHGTTVAALVAANALGAGAVIFPGQKLKLSGGSGSAQGAPAATQPAPAGSTQTAKKTHTVKAGDTLWGIAAANGISVAKLLDLNGLDASSIIYPGQKLTVKEEQKTQEEKKTGSIYDSPVYDLRAELNAPQAENARLIISIGRELGVSDKGIAIALATAMVESSLRNLDWGDRDSLGLFQQRPSAGWGTEEQILDRGYSTRVFFGGAGDPNGYDTRGLLDLPGWESMDFGDAAQAVQISAFPDRYDRWRVAAYGWLAQHG